MCDPKKAKTLEKIFYSFSAENLRRGTSFFFLSLVGFSVQYNRPVLNTLLQLARLASGEGVGCESALRLGEARGDCTISGGQV